MRKILYLIIAFLFCAECEEEIVGKCQYNDGVLDIEDEDNIRITIGKIEKRYKTGAVFRHLYNNGHIICASENVNSIEDMNRIVRARYTGLSGKAQALEKALGREVVTYINIDEEFNLKNKDFKKRVIKKMFGNTKRFNTKIVRREGNIEIKFLANGVNSWNYVCKYCNSEWSLIGAEIHIILDKKRQFLITVFSSANHNQQQCKKEQ